MEIVLTVGQITDSGYVVNNPGSGYTAGDTLIADGGNSDASFQVVSVDESGVITFLILISSSSGYATGTYNLTGGTGTGATLDVTQIQGGKLSQDFGGVSGNSYRASLIIGGTTGTIQVTFDDGASIIYPAGSGSVTFDGVFFEDSGLGLTIQPSFDFDGTIDDVSVFAVTIGSRQVSISENQNLGSNLLLAAAYDGKVGIYDQQSNLIVLFDTSALTSNRIVAFPDKPGVFAIIDSENGYQEIVFPTTGAALGFINANTFTLNDPVDGWQANFDLTGLTNTPTFTLPNYSGSFAVMDSAQKIFGDGTAPFLRLSVDNGSVLAYDDSFFIAGSGVLRGFVGGQEIFSVDSGGVMFPGGAHFVGYTSSASTPTTTELPNDKDMAIHKDTNSGAVYLAFNDGGGTIKKIALT